MSPPRATRLDGPESEPILPSVLFWLCTFAAVTIFAAVYLAPKLVALRQLEVRHTEMAVRLDRLERRNAFLRRVIAALENDPDFTAEVARFDMDTTAPGEEQVPAPLVRPGAAGDQGAKPSLSGTPWWLPPAEVLTADRTLNDACLLTAAGLAVVAFTFFHPTIQPRRRAKRRGGMHAARRSETANAE